ncbi:MAG: hypothetical protein CVU62_13885 [Deltaproteobacteria bacterium HGW-Deltaproteobacteria-2]|jgi:hypothetical protein|nr:MAG: hypothetical protein CVU62_13885 [Deltaproteobacteria bacterium HGW-Deltaproteobacteria-2]
MKVDYIFCLPGNPSSGKQAVNVNVAMIDLMNQGKAVGIKQAKSCNIYVVRNGCLKEEANSRIDQKPFEGVYEDYDRIIWVDSDNIINPKAINKLIAHDVDIVAAWYRQYSDGQLDDTNKTACGLWKLENGRSDSRPYLVNEMANMPRNEKGLLEVDYAGMGLMVIKKGVFEALTYPWFTGWTYEWEENGTKMADVMTDDAGFCFRIKEKGFKIYVDPEVRIKHEKVVSV